MSTTISLDTMGSPNSPSPMDNATVSSAPHLHSNSRNRGRNQKGKSSSWVPKCCQSFTSFLRKHILPLPIPDENDYFTMSVWHRLYHYRRIPFIFLVNIFICGLLISYIEIYQLFINDYIVHSRYALSGMMVSPADETDSSLTTSLYDIQQFEDFLVGWVSGYYSVPMQSSGVFMHFCKSEHDREAMPPQLEMKFSVDRTFTTYRDMTFDLTEEDPLGPFRNVSELVKQNESCIPYTDYNNNYVIPCRNDTIADFFDMLVSCSVSAEIRGVVANPVYGYASVLKWVISTDFTFNARNSVMQADTSLNYLETQRLQAGPIYIIVAVGLLSMFGIVAKLNWWARHTDFPKRARSQGYLTKFYTARNWNFYGLFTDSVSLAFSIFGLALSFFDFNQFNDTQWKCVTIATAAFFQFLFMLAHFQNVPKMYVIAQSIGNALPKLVSYFISVFPMFFGFCICASAGFGGYSTIFNSLPNSMITFFCMTGGDSLLFTFTSANQAPEIPLQIFTALVIGGFIIFFIGGMLNMMLAIVQDSYTVGKSLMDMDERVLKEIHRDEGHKRVINNHYNKAASAAGQTTRRTFIEAMGGGDGMLLGNRGDDGAVKGNQRYEVFTNTELIALRKRFHVLPRTGVGYDCSSTSSSSSSACCSDSDLKIDEELRAHVAKEKIRQMRKTRPRATSVNESITSKVFADQERRHQQAKKGLRDARQGDFSDDDDSDDDKASRVQNTQFLLTSEEPIIRSGGRGARRGRGGRNSRSRQSLMTATTTTDSRYGGFAGKEYSDDDDEDEDDQTTRGTFFGNDQ